MDPIINDRCVKMARLTRSADFKTSRFCLPRLPAQGRVFLTTLSAVVATSGSTIRTRNTGVTANSICIRCGSYRTPGALIVRIGSKNGTSAMALSAILHTDIHKFSYLMQWFLSSMKSLWHRYLVAPVQFSATGHQALASPQVYRINFNALQPRIVIASGKEQEQALRFIVETRL